MAIAFRAESHVIGTGTSATGTEPAGTTTGDVMVAVYIVDLISNSIGIPSGWNSLEGGNTQYSAGNFVYNICYIVRGASAPSLSFTHTGSTYRELTILSFSGVDNTWPIDAFEVIPSTTAASNNPNPPAVNAVSTNTMAVAIGVCWGGSGTGGYGAPSGYTIRTNNAAGEDIAVATKSLSSAGSEDPAAFTNASSAINDAFGATITLSPSGISAPTSGPLLVGEYESPFNANTSSKSTTITVNSTTDVLVLSAITADSGTTFNTPTGGSGVSWTLQKSDTTASYTGVYIWTATNISPQTFTVTLTSSGGTDANGINLMRFANASIGASAKGQSASGAPSVNLTTTTANSAIVILSGDWAAVDGTSRTWRSNAGTLTEKTYFLKTTTVYTTYVGVHKNAGAAGTYAVGLTAPSGQKYNIVAVEIISSSQYPVAWYKF